MGNAMQAIEWLVICLTFVGGVFMYVNHSRKLNRQQEKLNDQDKRLNDQELLLNDQQQQINEYQLKKNKEDEENSLKAQIECNVIKSALKGKADKLVVYNRGRSEAFNITVELIQADGIDFMIRDNFLPYPKLLPQQSFDIRYMPYLGKKPHYTLKMTWNDSSGQNKEVEQIVEL